MSGNSNRLAARGQARAARFSQTHRAPAAGRNLSVPPTRVQGAAAPLRRALGVLLLAAGATGAAPALAIDLVQAYRQAQAGDPVFAGQRASYLAGLEQLPQARAGLLPRINASGGTAYSDARTKYSSDYYASQSSNTHNLSYTLSLTQPLYDWASWQGFEQSKLAVTVTELDLERARQDLLLRVSQAYFDILVAQDTLTALEAEKSAIAEQLAFARRNFELGTATITDSYEAQARYDLIEAQSLQAANELQVRRNLLEQVIGQAPGALSVLPPGTPVPAPEPARIEAWSTRAETDNFAVVQALLGTEIAKYDVDIARAGHYPTVSLTGSFGQNQSPLTNDSVGGGNSRRTNSSVGVQVNIPVFTGGLTSSRVTQRAALEQRARHDYENARRTAIQSARTEFLGVNSGLAQIRALEAGEESSRKALEANQIGYEVGVRINLDVLNAQQQLYATQRDLARARYQALMAGLRLKAAAGLLTEADLEAINQLLRRPT